MKRRSFLAGLLALPLVKYLPTPKPAPVVAGVDFGGFDQTSIWLVCWGPSIYSVEQIVTPCRAVKLNWLKKELNK